jgi:DNA-binding response OmpR family regulator
LPPIAMSIPEDKVEKPAREEKAARRPAVLIIEDDENIAMMLKYLIGREGFNPVVVPDGREAVERFERYKPPALILMDMKLPFVDGFRLVQLARQQAGWEDVPIIMLTSVTEEKMISRVLDAGASDYVVKPFQTLDLLARVRRYVRRS